MDGIVMDNYFEKNLKKVYLASAKNELINKIVCFNT